MAPAKGAEPNQVPQLRHAEAAEEQAFKRSDKDHSQSSRFVETAEARAQLLGILACNLF